ncbi:unnamed protein product [Spirodela intermedia]|uniref:Uncharacterized protein n=1 Tax=Spirodela intermedia TaxID=51605 RepID=A0A7I8IXR0_SPIIN|nr:unnamed protein product [Spirodela intermedia]CAA6662796.1 unnamed protein product [Spirodela intermedia]
MGTSGTQGQRIARLVKRQETTTHVVESLMEQWQTELVAIEALSTKLNEEIRSIYDQTRAMATTYES